MHFEVGLWLFFNRQVFLILALFTYLPICYLVKFQSVIKLDIRARLGLGILKNKRVFLAFFLIGKLVSLRNKEYLYAAVIYVGITMFSLVAEKVKNLVTF